MAQTPRQNRWPSPSPCTNILHSHKLPDHHHLHSSSSKYSFSCSSPRLIATPHGGSPKVPSHPRSNLGLPRPSLPIKHKALKESLGLKPTLSQDLVSLLNHFPRTTLSYEHCSQGKGQATSQISHPGNWRRDGGQEQK